MAQSLSPKCTPLKARYDACFNAWFEGYLEPALAQDAPSQEREAYFKRKAQEFDERCGQVWKEYQACVTEAVKARGLEDLLNAARDDNPSTSAPTS